MHYTYTLTTWLYEYYKRAIPTIVTSVGSDLSQLRHFFIFFLNSFTSLLMDSISLRTGLQNGVNEERKVAFTPVL